MKHSCGKSPSRSRHLRRGKSGAAVSPRFTMMIALRAWLTLYKPLAPELQPDLDPVMNPSSWKRLSRSTMSCVGCTDAEVMLHPPNSAIVKAKRGANVRVLLLGYAYPCPCSFCQTPTRPWPSSTSSSRLETTPCTQSPSSLETTKTEANGNSTRGGSCLS